jgi:hypothetical protein
MLSGCTGTPLFLRPVVLCIQMGPLLTRSSARGQRLSAMCPWYLGTLLGRIGSAPRPLTWAPARTRGGSRCPLPAAPSLAVLRLGPGSRGPGTPAAPQRLNPEEARERRSAGARRGTGSARGAGSSAGRSAGRSESAGARGAPPAPSFVWRGRGGAGPRRVPVPAPAPARRSGPFPARWQPRPPSTLRVSSGPASGRAWDAQPRGGEWPLPGSISTGRGILVLEWCSTWSWRRPPLLRVTRCSPAGSRATGASGCQVSRWAREKFEAGIQQGRTPGTLSPIGPASPTLVFGGVYTWPVYMSQSFLDRKSLTGNNGLQQPYPSPIVWCRWRYSLWPLDLCRQIRKKMEGVQEWVGVLGSCWNVAGEPYCHWQSSLSIMQGWEDRHVTAFPLPSFRFCVVCFGSGES